MKEQNLYKQRNLNVQDNNGLKSVWFQQWSVSISLENALAYLSKQIFNINLNILLSYKPADVHWEVLIAEISELYQGEFCFNLKLWFCCKEYFFIE